MGVLDSKNTLHDVKKEMNEQREDLLAIAKELKVLSESLGVYHRKDKCDAMGFITRKQNTLDVYTRERKPTANVIAVADDIAGGLETAIAIPEFVHDPLLPEDEQKIANTWSHLNDIDRIDEAITRLSRKNLSAEPVNAEATAAA